MSYSFHVFHVSFCLFCAKLAQISLLFFPLVSTGVQPPTSMLWTASREIVDTTLVFPQKKRVYCQTNRLCAVVPNGDTHFCDFLFEIFLRQKRMCPDSEFKRSLVFMLDLIRQGVAETLLPLLSETNVRYATHVLTKKKASLVGFFFVRPETEL